MSDRSPDTDQAIGAIDDARRRDRLAAIALIVANLVPLVGVLFFGWDLLAVMLLFWLESAVIGIYTVIKMIIVGRWAGAALGLFFVFHYGMFMLGHLAALAMIVLIGQNPPPHLPDGDPFTVSLSGLDGNVLLAALALMVSHGISFVVHFVRAGERPPLEKLMSRPYGRIVAMHLAVILGAFGAVTIGSPIWILALLVILKTGIDLWSHRREHGVKRTGDEPAAT